MAYSTTRTTTGSRLRRSLAAYSRDSHDPSARTWSTGSVGAVLPVLARHNSSAPVAAAVRHSLAPTNNRSANSSTPAKPPCSTSPSSRPASVVSPVAYDPIAALIVAWVPHSTSPTTRTCGNAPVPSPRPQPPPPIPRPRRVRGRQRPSSLGKQHLQRLRTQPSARLHQRRLHRQPPQPPRVGVAAPGAAQRLHQQPQHLQVGDISKQRQRQHVIDHHAGGQQPAALLAPARLGQHPIHQPWWERTGQRADRDPIPQPLRRWRLDLPCPWHHASSAPSTNTKDADNTTPTMPN